MELEYAFFARYVEQASDGTLTIAGADMGRIAVDRFPIVMPSLFAVVKFRPPMQDVLRIKFRIDGPEGVGEVLNSGDWHETIARKEESGASEGGRVVLGLPPFPLPVAGTYQFSFDIEDGPTAKLLLKVVEAKGSGT